MYEYRSQRVGTKVDIDRKIEAAFANIQRKLVEVPRVRAPFPDPVHVTRRDAPCMHTASGATGPDVPRWSRPHAVRADSRARYSHYSRPGLSPSASLSLGLSMFLGLNFSIHAGAA